MLKKRNRGAVVYSESAPEGWEEILKLKGISWARSPLHDSDINPNRRTQESTLSYYFIFSWSYN